MCGIAGCFQQADGASLIGPMSERMAHRGPDDAGLYKFENGGVSFRLAHRRLSVIDLSSAGHQPMRRDGLVLCYNGELYNYRALRADLVAAGVPFTTQSDTEVVLESWRRWGHESLRRFRGMFAFAIFDERSGRLVLARDHLGIKPLHYMLRKDGVVFASELKSIVRALGEAGDAMEADPAALVAAILCYWVPAGRCAVRGVEKLAPGSWAEFLPDGRHAVRRYWSLPEVAAEAAAGPPADIGPVIEESVAAHLVADVPVSSFLSGGLDSSIVTALAVRSSPDVDAFTITFRSQDHRIEAMPDDARYARIAARHLGIQLHEIEASPAIAELLPRIVDVLDEPVGDPAAINTLLVSEAARDAGVKVMLSGMGADELFSGYRRHLACLLAARYRAAPASVRRAVRASAGILPVVAGGRGLRRVRWGKRFLEFADLSEAEAFGRSYSLYDREGIAELVAPELGRYVDEAVDEHVQAYADAALDDPVGRMCLADSTLFLPGLNLAYTDRASMAASVEVRVPFVDPMVAAAAFSLPATQRIRGRTAKVALKVAAEPWLPREIVHRPKASFGVPLRAWISRDLRELVDDELVGGTLVASGFLRKGPLERLVWEERSGRADRSKQLWQLLTTELWCRQARASGVAA